MTIDQITAEIEADEAATLADPIIVTMARAAANLAEKIAPGTLRPNPGLPGSLYGTLISDAERVARLRFVARMGERPTGASGGYFTREGVMRDVTVVLRRAAK